jgi:tyrosine-protein phosphatase SIW14
VAAEEEVNRASRNLLSVVLAALLSAAQAGCRATAAHGDRDLPNFQQVSPTLYRGGQPTPAGLARLRDSGVRTVVNVRDSDDDREEAATLGLERRQQSMSPWKPRDADVAWFLAIACDPAQQPVFLHCQQGSDRTGYLIAMYRVVVEGWDRERAIEEMTRDGNGFYDLFQGLIDYVREADVERIRAMMAAQ